MKFRTFLGFINEISAIEAREMLGEAISASFPHMDVKGRERLRRQWMRRAGIEEVRKPGIGWAQLRQLLKSKPPPKVPDPTLKRHRHA